MFHLHLSHDCNQFLSYDPVLTNVETIIDAKMKATVVKKHKRDGDSDSDGPGDCDVEIMGTDKGKVCNDSVSYIQTGSLTLSMYRVMSY